MGNGAGYKTQAEAVKAAKVSDLADLYRSFEVVRMMTGRYDFQRPGDEPMTPMRDGGAMAGGVVVAYYSWSSRTRKWAKMGTRPSPIKAA